MEPRIPVPGAASRPPSQAAAGMPGRVPAWLALAALAVLLLAAGGNVAGCVRKSGARAETREVRITQDGKAKNSLRFSPDGRSIAFAQGLGEGKALLGVFVKPIAGGEARLISPDTVGLLPLRWSGDGASVLCVDLEGRQLYRLGLDGSVGKLGAAGPLSRFADVSPDGATRLVVTFRKDNRDVDIVGPNGVTGALAPTPEWEQGGVLGPGPGQATVISAASFEAPVSTISIRTGGESGVKVLPLPDGRKYSPVWSPDGRKLAYVVSSNGQLDVWSYDVATASATPAIQDPQDAASPQWSPDGGWLAFYRSVRTSRLFMGEPGEANRRQLTHGPANDYEPKASPDGKWIAFMRRSAPGTEGAERLALMIMPVAGGAPTEIDLGGRSLPLKGSEVCWSEDSEQLAFSAREGGGGLDVYRVRRDGSGLLRVTMDAGDEIDPRWSPDGRQISYTRVGGGKTQVLVLPANGGVSRVMSAEGALSEGVVWSPDGSEVISMVYRPDGGFELWRAAVSAPERRRLVIESRELAWPVRWTPDGQHLVLARGGGQTWYFTDFDLASAAERRIAVQVPVHGGMSMVVKFLPEGERYRKLLFPGGMLSAEGEETGDFYMIPARALAASRQLSAGDGGLSWFAHASWGESY